MSLKINPLFVEGILTRFIRDELGKHGFRKGILGLSGGLDSTVCAALAARALGPRNVLGLIMPYGKSFPAEIRDAEKAALGLGIRTRTIDIAPQVDIYFSAHPTGSRVLRGNKMARERMSILYDYSAREKALILGTSNKTELLIGYGTVHGDMASAVNPMGDLYKT
ncbi:MAG: NAD(+) synthase, partial [Candidatus Aminicenantales bacterium]